MLDQNPQHSNLNTTIYTIYTLCLHSEVESDIDILAQFLNEHPQSVARTDCKSTLSTHLSQEEDTSSSTLRLSFPTLRLGFASECCFQDFWIASFVSFFQGHAKLRWYALTIRIKIRDV